MGLETGTYIQDLNENNPISGDPVAEGDNHLRLIKAVLKATFPTATRAMPTPTAIYRGPSGSFSVTEAQEGSINLLDTTSGQVNLTMPSLSAAKGGWSCTAMKISWNTGPAYIFPPSGTIQSGERLGLGYTRRCIPGLPTRIMWTGSNWHCSRVPSVPVGTCLPYQGGDLPVGYEWPNGQTLSPGAYPEFAQIRGGGLTMDHRGRAPVMADQGIGRIGGGIAGGVNSGAYDGAGGEYIHYLTLAEIASHAHAGTTDDRNQGHTHTFSSPVSNAGGGFQVGGSAAGFNPPYPATSGTTDGENQGHTHTFTTDSRGSSSYHNNMQPSIVEHFILVVE